MAASGSLLGLFTSRTSTLNPTPESLPVGVAKVPSLSVSPESVVSSDSADSGDASLILFRIVLPEYENARAGGLRIGNGRETRPWVWVGG